MISWLQKWKINLHNGNVFSIHKNIKKDRGTKNEFHWRIFCKTPIRRHSCTTHCVQTVPVLAAILQKILWNPIISYLYLFYVFMNTWRHSRIKLSIVRWTLSIFKFFSNRQIFIINAHTVKHTLCSGLNRLQIYVTEIKEKQIFERIKVANMSTFWVRFLQIRSACGWMSDRCCGHFGSRRGSSQRNRHGSAICKKRSQKCGVATLILLNIGFSFISVTYNERL